MELKSIYGLEENNYHRLYAAPELLGAFIWANQREIFSFLADPPTNPLPNVQRSRMFPIFDCRFI